jgi:hypothetical protein
MSALLSMIAKWLAHKALLLLLILGLLVTAVWLRAEWSAMSDTVREMEEKRIARDLLAERARIVVERAEELTEHGAVVLREYKDKETFADAVWADVRGLEAERNELRNRHWWARKNPFSSVSRKIMLLDANIKLRREAAQQAERLREKAQRLVEASPELREAAMLRHEANQLESSMIHLESQIRADEQKLEKDPVHRVLAEAQRQLPLALLILAGVIAMPVGIKALLYFAVAPLAGRIPPIRILPSSNGIVRCHAHEDGAGVCSGRISSVSIDIVLQKNDELLIHADYLQSSSLSARKRTKWLLNPGLPFSSIAAGMFTLIRITAGKPTNIVVSSTRDPLREVALLHLPEDSVLICRPRALAGIVQQRDRRLRITRHWRLTSIHAWLTMQLRYLAFHGPCTLILGGCRGVRVEQATTGRLINQAATLAFSANVAYANTRCETFVAYWAGKEDLFNDVFSGTPGVYVYEELPDAARRSGITGRGFEGFVDSMLKVFGI